MDIHRRRLQVRVWILKCMILWSWARHRTREGGEKWKLRTWDQVIGVSRNCCEMQIEKRNTFVGGSQPRVLHILVLQCTAALQNHFVCIKNTWNTQIFYETGKLIINYLYKYVITYKWQHCLEFGWGLSTLNADRWAPSRLAASAHPAKFEKEASKIRGGHDRTEHIRLNCYRWYASYALNPSVVPSKFTTFTHLYKNTLYA